MREELKRVRKESEKPPINRKQALKRLERQADKLLDEGDQEEELERLKEEAERLANEQAGQ